MITLTCGEFDDLSTEGDMKYLLNASEWQTQSKCTITTHAQFDKVFMCQGEVILTNRKPVLFLTRMRLGSER